MIVGGRAHSIDEVERIAAAGFPFVEISILNERSFAADFSRLKRIQDSCGISYLAHGPEEGAAADPEALRRDYLPLVRAVLDAARELGVALCTIHFWMDRRFIPLEHLPAKQELLREMVAYADGRGIVLCIENLSERVADFTGAFAAIDDLGMTLDLGHGALLSRRNTAYNFTRRCFDRIRHVHIHDNRGGDSPRDDLHLPLGDGLIDFAPLLSGLKRRGYDKTITIEVRPAALPHSSRVLRRIWESV